MMDPVRKTDPNEHKARRQARRALREKRVYTHIKEALNEASGEFSNRYAYLWSHESDRDSTRKIQGHAGTAASLYVAETLGDFNIPGSVRTRFVGMERSAGHGGHGITEGVLTVDVEIQPVRGITQTIEVPVYVRNGHMLQPGLLYHEGTPYILAQSSINEILDQACIGGEVKTDRRSLYSPPKQASSRPRLTQKDFCKPTKDEVEKSKKENKQEEDEKARAKARWKNRAPREPVTGSQAKLACEILVPVSDALDEGYRLAQGSNVTIVASQNEQGFVHVRHESGVEAFIASDYLDA